MPSPEATIWRMVSSEFPCIPSVSDRLSSGQASKTCMRKQWPQGGVKNPHPDPLIIPLELTDQEKHDLVAFLHTLNGEGWQHVTAPKSFPK